MTKTAQNEGRRIVMGKATKMCDFDKPETPTEMIIRGLTIALRGAEEEAKERYAVNWVDDISKMITSVKACHKQMQNERRAEEKYAKELAPAVFKSDTYIRFEFDESVEPWVPRKLIIESSFPAEYELDPKTLRKSVKKGVEDWMRKEKRNGKKTKIGR